MGIGGGLLTPHILYHSNKFKINAWLIPGALGLGAFLFIFFLK
jgi:hypothetical protein